MRRALPETNYGLEEVGDVEKRTLSRLSLESFRHASSAFVAGGVVNPAQYLVEALPSSLNFYRQSDTSQGMHRVRPQPETSGNLLCL